MESRQIILAGIGMGSGDVITEEVRQLIEEADCLIGAERMITSAQKIRSMNGLISVRETTGMKESLLRNIVQKRLYPI